MQTINNIISKLQNPINAFSEENSSVIASFENENYENEIVKKFIDLWVQCAYKDSAELANECNEIIEYYRQYHSTFISFIDFFKTNIYQKGIVLYEDNIFKYKSSFFIIDFYTYNRFTEKSEIQLFENYDNSNLGVATLKQHLQMYLGNRKIQSTKILNINNKGCVTTHNPIVEYNANLLSNPSY